jgi:hypothetical protein
MHQEESFGEGSAQGIEQADRLIPAREDHARVQHNLKELVMHTEAEGKDADEISHKTRMHVRIFNACISCPPHERELG